MHFRIKVGQVSGLFCQPLLLKSLFQKMKTNKKTDPILVPPDFIEDLNSRYSLYIKMYFLFLRICLLLQIQSLLCHFLIKNKHVWVSAANNS